MEPLSGLDATFLYAETPTTPMNVIATVVIEGCVSLEEVVERVRERLPDLPSFRKRLVETPFGLDHPAWIDDPDFDVREHVIHLDAPPPGDDRALETVVAQVARRRLDRARPLWEIGVVAGLTGERTALVVKAHHAAVDGVSGAAILLHLFDRPAPRDAAEPGSGELAAPQAEPGPTALLGYGLSRWLGRPRRYWDAARQTGAAVSDLTRGLLASDPAVRDAALPFQAPACSFNATLSSRRSIAYARMPMGCIELIRQAFGGTVNDVVLSACTRALQGEMWERGEPAEQPLLAGVPVSTRRPGDAPGGNRVSALVARLPVQLEDPLHQLSEVKRSTRQGKRVHGLLGPDTLAALAEVLSPSLAQPAFSLYGRWKLAALHRPLVNLTISNVPGPPAALGFCGRPVYALHPHGPLMEGVGLNITAMSYAGSIDVGVLGCAERVPEAHRIADRVAQAIEELTKLAETSLPDVPPLARVVA
jgi:WS/DGAT/MGAT family acyltransferase